jgi:hypothetical protein
MIVLHVLEIGFARDIEVDGKKRNFTGEMQNELINSDTVITTEHNIRGQVL